MRSFVKMHGLGNDFVIFDARVSPLTLSATQVGALADRRRGIGCDQVAILRAPVHPDAHIWLDIINIDGRQVEACGNLTRCVAALLHGQGAPASLVVETCAGLLAAQVNQDGTVCVNMGGPRTQWDAIPLSGPMDTQSVLFADTALPPGQVVSMGNPHCVFIVDDLADFDIAEVGADISTRSCFPEQANVELIQVLGRDQLQMRVWERAIGVSVACGSGACAAFSAAHARGFVDAQVQVHMPGGTLDLMYTPAGEIVMQGPVFESFSGQVALSLL